MTKFLPESFEPRLGLSRVFAIDEAVSAGLPDDSRLQPIDAAVEAQLRALLQAETFDALILDAVRPKAVDRGVLAPFRFHFLREEIIACLTRRLDAVTDASHLADLRAAAALLRARSSEHELGEALRYALLKG